MGGGGINWLTLCTSKGSYIAAQNKAFFFLYYLLWVFRVVPFNYLTALEQSIYYIYKAFSTWSLLKESDYFPKNMLVLATEVLYLYHRYLPARLELFQWLLLLNKSSMRLMADCWIKLFYDEFQFGNRSQSRRKCLHSTSSQWREILDWTQWPKCGGLLCVDKQRNKQI